MTASTDSFSAPASASSPVAPPSPDPQAFGQRLFIQRRHIQEAFIGPDPDAPSARPLQPGQARLAIDSFSLTANNVTYAAFGEAMQYWQFFPSGQEGLGCLPVWGFATVCESGVEGVPVGRRLWGYWPAGTHLVVQPARVGPAGCMAQAWSSDIALVQAQQWMRIVRHRGAAQVLQAHLDMVAGQADAQKGWMLDLHANPEAGR